MHPTVRSFYNLEELWGGKEVKLKAPVQKKKVVAKKRVPAKKKKARGKAPRRRAGR
jgi:hypothetical protein